MFRRRTALWTFAPLVVAIALLASACGGDEGGASEAEASDLRAQLAGAGQDSRYWQQLTSLMEPVELSR